MKKPNFSNPSKAILGPRTRWSYANVWEPKSINGGTAKYSISLIIPKDDKETIDAVNAAIQSAYKNGEARLRGNNSTVPTFQTIKTPLRDGDIERPDDETYANSYFLNVNSEAAPQIVDAFHFSGCGLRQSQ